MNDAAAILRTRPNRYGELFPDPNNLRSTYKELLRSWHPDVNDHPEAAEVTGHITALFEVAKSGLEAGTYVTPREVHLRDRSQLAWAVKPYKRWHSADIGEVFYGPDSIHWLIDPAHAPLAENAKRVLRSVRFSNPAMRKEFERFLPREIGRFTASDGHVAVMMKKTPDTFLLQHLLDHAGGTIAPEHTAWIVSALLNLASFFEHNQVAHNGITMDSVFVSPEFHSAMVYGGWWFSGKLGAPMKFLPSTLFRELPPRLLSARKHDVRVDLYAIRRLGAELLGDRSGTRLAGRCPAPMATFLRSPPADSALEDFRRWVGALYASFGPRRFVKWEVAGASIYGKG